MAAFSNKPKDYLQLFSDTMIETFQVLRKVYPDQRFLMKVEGKYIKTERSTYIEYTLNNIKPHVSYLCSQDSSIFGSDYQTGPLHLLVGLDFKKFWHLLSAETQEQLFIQLQLLFIYGSLATHTNKSLARDMVANLKFTQELDQRVAEAEAKEREKSQFSIESFLGKNSPLVAVFMDLSQDQSLIQELEKLASPLGPEASAPETPTTETPSEAPAPEEQMPAPETPTTIPEASSGLGDSSGLGGPSGPSPLDSQNLLETNKLIPLLMNIVQNNNLEPAITLIRSRIEFKLKEKNLGPEEIEAEIKKAIARARAKFSKNPIYKALQIDKMIDNFINSAETDQNADNSFSDISEKIKAFMRSMQNNAMKNQHIAPEQMAKIAEMMQSFTQHLNRPQEFLD